MCSPRHSTGEKYCAPAFWHGRIGSDQRLSPTASAQGVAYKRSHVEQAVVHPRPGSHSPDTEWRVERIYGERHPFRQKITDAGTPGECHAARPEPGVIVLVLQRRIYM